MAMPIDKDSLSSPKFTFGNGDVRILLTCNDGTEATALVSSHALSLASPIWKALLHPTVPQLDFRHIAFDALIIILAITHLKFRDVPQRLPYATLLHVATLCNDYDCVDLVTVFLPQWLADEAVESLKPGQENWLFITWVFGRNEVFENLATHMVKSMYLDEHGQWCISGGVLRGPWPPKIFDRMVSVRKSTIKALLSICYEQTNYYTRRETRTTRCEFDFAVCDSTSYGSLVLGYNAIGLWPAKSADDIRCAISELVSGMRGVEVHTLGDRVHGGRVERH
ncbi:hypothetical protein LAWI1_G005080, partial [Lachnellula willkommii]